MKLISNSILFAIVAFNISCASTAKFPVSSVVPAAVISAKKVVDKNNNFVIELTAKNLASPERLIPPKNNYSVWVLTEYDGVKNIGQLKNENAKKATLKTLTVFDVNEIFITAEDQGDLSSPMGVEITRTSFSVPKANSLMKK